MAQIDVRGQLWRVRRWLEVVKEGWLLVMVVRSHHRVVLHRQIGSGRQESEVVGWAISC